MDRQDNSVHQRRVSVRGGGLAGLLVLGGFLLAAGGGALIASEHLTWHVVRARQEVESFGVAPTSLVFLGAVVFAVGLAARAAVCAARSVARQMPAPAGGEDELALVAGQLAGDLAQVKGSISRLSEGLAAISSTQAQVMHRLSEESSRSSSGDQGAHDGLFRLAASLDKLGAQMDERIQGLDSKIRSKIDGVAQAIEQARHAMQTRTQPGPTPAPGAPSASVPPSVTTTAPAAPAASARPAPAPRPKKPGGPFDDDAETLVMGVEEREMDVLVELEKELAGEPSLEFFDAVENSDLDEDAPLNLDIESPRGPLRTGETDALDALMPDEDQRA